MKNASSKPEQSRTSEKWGPVGAHPRTSGEGFIYIIKHLFYKLLEFIDQPAWLVVSCFRNAVVSLLPDRTDEGKHRSGYRGQANFNIWEGVNNILLFIGDMAKQLAGIIACEAGWTDGRLGHLLLDQTDEGRAFNHFLFSLFLGKLMNL